jgi:hypothetical protein
MRKSSLEAESATDVEGDPGDFDDSDPRAAEDVCCPREAFFEGDSDAAPLAGDALALSAESARWLRSPRQEGTPLTASDKRTTQ